MTTKFVSDDGSHPFRHAVLPSFLSEHFSDLNCFFVVLTQPPPPPQIFYKIQVLYAIKCCLSPILVIG